MIPFKTPIGTLKLPSNFDEITVKDWEFIKNNPDKPLEVVELLTGMTGDKLVRLDLDPLILHLEFLKVDLLAEFEPCQTITLQNTTYELPDDIKKCQWGQKLLANQAFRDSEFTKMVAVYLQPFIKGSEKGSNFRPVKNKFDNEKIDETIELLETLSVESVYSCVTYITKQLEEIAVNEKVLKADISGDQISAGISMFNALGDFNTIDLIAGGDVLKYDAVLEIDYNTIFNKLYHIKISSKFEKRLSEILTNKNKAK